MDTLVTDKLVGKRLWEDSWLNIEHSAFCSVLVVLVISLTVDLVEIAGCSLGPQWSRSQQSASHSLKAGSQWTLHQVLPTLHKPLTTGT